MKNEVTIAVCNTHYEAEKVVKELQQSGFNMKKLSIIGKDFHQEDNIVGYYNTGDAMKTWGKVGAFWGGVWGLIFGAGFFIIPGIGPLVMAGPFVATFVGGLEGAVIVAGLSAIGVALFRIGIPKNSVLKYESDLKADKYLVMAHGTSEEIEKAKDIMNNSSSSIEVSIHH